MRVLILILLLLPGLARAEDKLVRFYAAPELVDSGLIQHIRPRFSLKTQVRVEMVAEAEADLTLASDGIALFSGLGRTWHMNQRGQGRGAKRFADWLTSDVGARTVRSFAPEGAPLFTAPEVQQVIATQDVMPGDAVLGREVSEAKCGRCHVTQKGGFSIGSTPSFFVMRNFDDWEARFSGFFILKPHGAFTQIAGVTDPFPIDRPSPISVIALNIDELEAIVAYVAGLEPANLGAPLAHQ
ncbi:MAG: hypothetical protein AAGM84_00870 [Pseudomonadota bacterium]